MEQRKVINKEKAKEHHWVPQTYMKGWVKSNSSIYEFNNRGKKVGEPKNIKHILKIKHLYSKKVDDLYALDEDNLDDMLYKNLSNLQIKCGDNVLTSWKDYCSYFKNFDSWIIEKDGKKIGKKFRNAIEQKINYWYDVEIEDLLAEKIDDKWGKIRNYLEEEICSSKTICKVEKFKKEILEFILIQYFRTPFKKELVSIIDEVYEMFGKHMKEIGEEDEIHLMKRCHWLRSLEFYLENNEAEEVEKYNYIRQIHKIMIDGKFTFFVSQQEQFITSDSPAIMMLSNKWVNGVYMPLTPKVMIFIAKNSAGIDKNHYNIIDIDKKGVAYLNKLVLEESKEKIYSNQDSLKGIVGSNISKQQWIEYINQKLKVRGMCI